MSSPSFARPARPSLDILLAAALWGTSGTARAYSTLGPVAAGATKAVIGGLLLLALAAHGGGLRALLTGGAHGRLLLAVGAICVAIFQTVFYAAAARTGVAVGTVVTIGAGPVFTGLLSLATGLGRPGRRWAVATSGAVGGCALLVSGGHAAGVDPLGVLLALVSGFAYAAYATIVSHQIAAGRDDRAIVAVLFGGAAVLLAPLLATGGRLAQTATVSGLAAGVYLGVVATAAAYLLYARGLRSTPVTVAATLGLAEPAVAAVLGVTLLGEHLTALSWAGLALIAAALAILAAPARREHAAPAT